MTEVAIVGTGAVFPGDGDAPAFWRNIRAGTDAITDVSPDRWDPGIYCDPDQAGAGLVYTRRGGFLGNLATFDPGSFGIMPAAIEGTEPDQLLMLRAAAEAIEERLGPDNPQDAGEPCGCLAPRPGCGGCSTRTDSSRAS